MEQLPRDNFDLYETVQNLMDDKKILKMPAINKKYIEFRQKYEELYKMCTKRDLTKTEMEMLKEMVDTREQIRNNVITTEIADENIKELLFKNYHPDLYSQAKDQQSKEKN